MASLRTQLQDAAHDLRRDPRRGLRSTGLGGRQRPGQVLTSGCVVDSSQPRGALYVLSLTLHPICLSPSSLRCKPVLGPEGQFQDPQTSATYPSSEPDFFHQESGDIGRTHTGPTHKLSSHRHSSWNSSTLVCPFQLLKQTVLLIHWRCSIKVYYIKNTSLGLRHSGLKPMGTPPLNLEHTKSSSS